ncbi:helix-turn-helix transcriptional regulator [Roseovarius sp. EL26]|uniref:helix-turn-helix transcriptional regulator n=1 Tax=Roseovarius sp. EL26 TaxID=2126672 RepID=UPI000EA31C94|nr:helix-turn-helix transcriptional regulator [Roseovarius sp. EL26]
MSQHLMAGTRIRERRILLGMKQAELARRVSVSPSYLNLIEHNRRRIGGKTLLKIAEVLQVEPNLLSDGAGRLLVNGLREAAGVRAEFAAEVERVEEFAARFPGWAELLKQLNRERDELFQTVTSLTERMAHDPHLAASLHEVISTVTAIHSAASILVDTKELEPEWQGRFHRNINEDSQRLAEGAESLVRYLEGAPEAGKDIRSPHDELHAFLDSRDYHFPELEAGAGGAGEHCISDLLQQSSVICGPAARSLLAEVLYTYVADAAKLPIDGILHLISEVGIDPEQIALKYQVTLPQVFRRLAMLPADEVTSVGLMTCDVSGAILFRKPIDGFSLPRSDDGCALWPIYQVLTMPQSPVRVVLRQAGQEAGLTQAFAACELIAPAGFDYPAVMRAHMLLIPDNRLPELDAARTVGLNCRICTLSDCAARREPSILA